jgi:hypothetical protein
MPPVHRPDSDRRRRQRGVVMIWMAMFLLGILGFIALGIDTAKVAAARTQLQNAADAAALAGASALHPATGAMMPDTARARARAVALQNKAFADGPEPVQVLDSDIVVNAAERTVRVTVRRDGTIGQRVVTHVAQVLGITELDMRADATAKAEPAGSVLCGIAPLFVSPPPGEDFLVGCSNTYTLKYGAQGGTTGNYGGLRLPACDNGPCAGMTPNGANTYRCLLENFYCCEIAIGEVLGTQPGNMSGPTRQGIIARFNQDSDRRENICHSDYAGNGARIITVPMTTPAGGGHSDVTVTGFATFFLRRLPGHGNDSILYAEFLYRSVPGGAGGPSSGTALTLRLIE